jgi:DNA polymerase I-like protein with 3'-5' exonuclease and polymerase domains
MTRVWQDNLVRQVNNNKGLYVSCTGRQYQFELRDAPDFLKEKGVLKSYNPADIKNYPVQGLATADIVLIMLGRVWRKSLQYRHKYLMVNTVHDSLIIDCKPEYVDFACDLIKTEMCKVKEMMKELFNLDFNLHIDVEVKTGNSWYDCALD